MNSFYIFIVGAVVSLIAFLIKRALDDRDKRIDNNSEKIEELRLVVSSMSSDLKVLESELDGYSERQAETVKGLSEKMDKIIVLVTPTKGTR